MDAKTTLTRATVVALFAWAAWGHAADEQAPRHEDPQTAAQSSNASAERERSRSGTRLDELERCKEQAHGLKGPERARFMTECLASDRFEK